MAEIRDWAPSASDNDQTPSSAGWPRSNWDGQEVNDAARERMAIQARKHQASDHEFLDILFALDPYGGTKNVTRVNDNTITIGNLANDETARFPARARIKLYNAGTPVSGDIWIGSSSYGASTLTLTTAGPTLPATFDNVRVQHTRTLPTFVGQGTKAQRDTDFAQGALEGFLWAETDTNLLSLWVGTFSAGGWQSVGDLSAWIQSGLLEVRDRSGGGGQAEVRLRRVDGEEQTRLRTTDSSTLLEHYSTVDQTLAASIELKDSGEIDVNGASARTLLFRRLTTDANISTSTSPAAIPGFDNVPIGGNIIGQSDVLVQVRFMVDKNAQSGNRFLSMWTHANGETFTDGTQRLLFNLTELNNDLRSLALDVLIDASTWDATGDAECTWAVARDTGTGSMSVGGQGSKSDGNGAHTLSSFNSELNDESRRGSYFTMEAVNQA